MHGKDLIQRILNKTSHKNGFWHGRTHNDQIPILNKYFNVNGEYELGIKLHDTICWTTPHKWSHPNGLPMVNARQNGANVFADVSMTEIEKFDWPDVKYLDFTETAAELDKVIADGMGVLSGFWSPLINHAMEFFGYENLLIKMHTDPLQVQAVMEHLTDFYVQAHNKLFDAAGDRIDACFLASDFGTQIDLLISPQFLDRFFIPYIARIAGAIKARGYHVAFHSCGAVAKIIPQLIDAGIDVLHPVQPLAAGMAPEDLAKQFNGKIIFMGGVDTQRLLPFGTPQEVREEVKRLIDLFGPNYIVSPSHEMVEDYVSPQNIEAMAEMAATYL